MLHKTMFSTPVFQPCLKWISRSVLKLLGWKVEGEVPEDLKQCVLIAAPHTTNWDMPFSLMIAFVLDTSLYWVGKQSIFKFPFAGLMRWMGGIPVDRSRSNNMVDATVEQFAQHAELRIMMAPEGTRSEVKEWKSGFYHIAHGAGVPIALGFIDYKNKCGGIKHIFHTTGDYEQDLQEIKSFYKPYFDQT
ncbi:lysophospholipid acyltransferase family protein [Neptuniibacter sp.]|uniref:lysophospholipid acyltransferase family protein n=1 Tax=Neptuniibacter sp. TaxID=1962643 RepID=UPI0026153B47|nr:lysophospholipid acyltransferase family protein [Neptuniibacter sp.]MCP4598464.1 glycerol acyltransferase [Neptuniibacter sp.]